MFKIFRLSVIIILSLTSCVPIRPPETPPPPLVATLYDTVIFDIASIGSGTPSEEALVFLRSKIYHYRIARAVVIHQRQDISSPFMVWSLSQVWQFDKNHRQLHDRDPKDKILTIFVSYLPGVYINGNMTNITGIQYGTTSFAIFRTATKNEWEGGVLLHELGHLLQIARRANRTNSPVNPDRPNHCNNEDCVMFWRVSEYRTQFDSQCLRELQQLIRGEPLRRAKLY